MKIHLKSTLLILLITISLLTACQSASGVNQPPTLDPMEQPVSSDNPTHSTKPVNSDESQENVYVDSIQINIMESFPLQVSATINGNLPDGCTSIINSKADFDIDNATFTIHIYTDRPKEMDCTQALVPFTETIPLDVYGFAAGTYTVNAYQLTTTFKFESDNKITE